VTATAVVEDRVRAPAAAAPYKGLTPYDEDDAPFFFGRESERRIIVANLVGARLTLLYGESGVGKTSVLRAGVIPDLRRDAARNAEERGAPGHVAVVFSEWRDDPVRAVVGAIRAAAPELEPASSLDELLQDWTRTGNAVLLLVLDQFEEYLLYHPDRGAEDDFAAQLTRAVTRRDLRVHILIAIREDALARLDRFKGRIPHVFENYLRLEHLDLAAAHAAILKPLDRYNEDLPPSQRVSIEPRLVRGVLDHVRAEHVDHAAIGRGRSLEDDVSGRVETPYLQLVMRRLWTEEQAAGSRVLRSATLERLGGPEKIVHAHLDEAMASLSPEDRDVAAAAFHYLVTPSGTKIAYSAADLAGQAGLDEEHVGRVLERLSRHDARILRPVPPPPDSPGNARYEIFHDVLADAILDWRASHAQDKVRVAAKVRERNFFRIATVVLGIIVVALGALAALAVRQRDEAVQQRKLARSREIAVRSLTADTNVNRQVRLAKRAVAEAPTPLALTALSTALKNLDDSRTITGAAGPLTSASFTTGDTWVLTASEDGFARISRASDKRGGGVLGPPFGVPAVAPSASPTGAFGAAAAPDGRHAITWSGDEAPALWRGNPQTALWVKQRALGSVVAAAFAPDSATFAAADAGGRVRISRTNADTPVAEFTERGHTIRAIAFAPTGDLLVTVGSDGAARVRDGRDGALRRTIPASAGARAAAFGPEGRLLVTAGRDGRARVWDVATGRAGAVLGRRGERLNDARFSADGTQVVTAGSDGTVRVFDSGDRSRLAVFRRHARGHPRSFATAVFSANGRVVLTAGADGTARLWHWREPR
jgi:hypothetical protein